MHLYRNNGRFFPLAGKAPLRRGNWREQGESHAAYARYIHDGHNVGWIIPPDWIVLDVDPRNGGVESYDMLLAETGYADLAVTYDTVLTGGGGLHIYCKLPHQISCYDIVGRSKKYRGIDVKKHGGYVVAAGSVHPVTGQSYVAVNDLTRHDPVDIRIIAPWRRQHNETSGTVPAEISPAELSRILEHLDPTNYRDHDAWFALLAAAHTATGGAGCAEFAEWSMRDPQYADQLDQIFYRWGSLHHTSSPRTVATLYAELPVEVRRDIITRQKFDVVGGVSDIYQEIVADNVDNELEPDLVVRVCDRTLAVNRLVFAADNRWWSYDGKRWVPVQPDFVRQMILREYEKIGRTKAASAIIPQAELVMRARAVLDFTPGDASTQLKHQHSIINASNGEIWLDDKTGKSEFKPHNPKSYLVSLIPIDYDEKAKCPRFKKYLAEVFASLPDGIDVSRHLMEIIGYTIQSNKNLATVVMLHGSGSNGKSVLLKIISALLGPSVLPTSLDAIDVRRNNHAYASLPGKLALLDDDFRASAVLPDAELKKLSENKPIEVNPKNATPYTVVSTVTPYLACNHWPRTDDLTLAMRRRLHVFDFTAVFDSEHRNVDPDLSNHLISRELSGILSLALQGLRRLRRRGHFQRPKSCEDAIVDFICANNPVASFCATGLSVDLGAKTPLADVWAAYNRWSVQQGRKHIVPRNLFFQQLALFGVEIAADLWVLNRTITSGLISPRKDGRR